jgi:hypothetical protein
MPARQAFSATVLTESQHSLVYRSINRMRCFSWRYFVHFKVFIWATLLWNVGCCICDFCSEFLTISIVSCVRPYLCPASRRWRPYYKWHNKYVLCTYVGFVQCRLVYKYFKRLPIRLLRIFWVIIMFSNKVNLLGIRRLFSWLHGTRFVYLAYQHEMKQKGPESTNSRPILFLSKFFSFFKLR